jgi:hypothetical protein
MNYITKYVPTDDPLELGCTVLTFENGELITPSEYVITRLTDKEAVIKAKRGIALGHGIPTVNSLLKKARLVVVDTSVGERVVGEINPANAPWIRPYQEIDADDLDFITDSIGETDEVGETVHRTLPGSPYPLLSVKCPCCHNWSEVP